MKHIYVLIVIFYIIISKHYVVSTPQMLCQENSTTLYEYQHCFNEEYEAFDKTKLDIEDLLNSKTQLMDMFCTIQHIAKNMKTDYVIITDHVTDKKIPELKYKGTKYQYKPGKNERIFRDLLHFKASSYTVFVLFCKIHCSADILHLGWLAELFSKNIYWIVIDKTLSQLELKMPVNLLSFGFNQNAKIDEDTDEVIDCSMNSGHYSTSTANFQSDVSSPDMFLCDHHKGWLSTRDWSVFHTHLGSIWGKDIPSLQSLRTVIVEEPPFTMISPEKPSNHNTCQYGKSCYREIKINNNFTENVYFCCYGYSIDLARILEKHLDIHLDFYFVSDDAYGRNVNGTWIGMVGDLVKQKADLVVAPLSIFKSRSEVIDFTDPYMDGGMSILTAAHDKHNFFNALVFKHLSYQLWLALVSMLLLCSLLLSGFEYVINKSTNTTESLMYLVGIIFQHDLGGENPKTLGGRVMSICFAIATLIVMTTYTAIMTANSIANVIELPINGFYDEKLVNPTKDFKFGTIADSTVADIFENTNIPEWRFMSEFMKPYNFKDTSQAAKDIHGGKLQAIITDSILVQYYASQDTNCHLKSVGRIEDAGLGLATRKGLKELNRDISSVIRYHRSIKTLEELKMRWFHEQCTSMEDKSLSLYSMGGLNILLITAIIVACSALFVEYCFSLSCRMNYGLT